MELILHIGAHRCGSTTIEKTVAQNLEVLGPEGFEIWPPKTFRSIPGFHRLPTLLSKGDAKRAKLTTIAEDLGVCLAPYDWAISS